jgi:thiamine pyrophosphate-dependent acetolactate synthase large subunit-like protein
LIAAVLEAPTFSTGISDDIRVRMIDEYVSRTHPSDLAQIAQVEEAIGLLEAATSMVFMVAKNVSEFPSEQVFSEFVDKAAPPVVETTRPKPASTSDEFHEKLLAEGRADIAALMAS